MRLTCVIAFVTLAACASSPVSTARGLLEDDDRFRTASDAGETFGRIGDVLLAAGEDCPEDANCEALRSAAAYAAVLGTTILTCTAPGRHDARQKMRSFLDTVEAADPDDPVPDSPKLPDCR